MEWRYHEQNGSTIAEATSERVLLQKEQDVITIMEELFESGATKVIFRDKNIVPEFFDLKTGLAGAILQKFVLYGYQLAIVGDFSKVTSSALKAFIYESNRGSQVFFLDSVDTALQKLVQAG